MPLGPRRPAVPGLSRDGIAQRLELSSSAGNWGWDARGPSTATGPGEIAEFDTRLPHWFGPAGDQPVEILSLLGPQGERIHVRAAPRRTADT
ncbi:hypothetical protein [Geodermatophilus poikilotrophus]|uniref:hypothetical protein n=1 Tax=Geodermatophilus poikilotrophus TaxID=1333667 RepID=UPI000B209D61|nr:hypothetical protein [Geodermatophilus poikilotrophus]